MRRGTIAMTTNARILLLSQQGNVPFYGLILATAMSVSGGRYGCGVSKG